MPLSSSLNKLLFWRRAKHSVELGPIHQRILTGLERFGDLPFTRLEDVVTAEHADSPGALLLALVKLEHDGLLIARRAGEGESLRVATYSLTDQGKHVARLLPPESASTIEFHL
jgi:hypothetical protein